MHKSYAYEVTRVAVLTSAVATMQANFRVVEAERNFSNLIKFQQKTKAEGVTKHNTMKITELTEGRYCFKVTKCLFFNFFSESGMPELTRIMCAVDNMVFNAYLPNHIVFERGIGQTLAEGAHECDFNLFQKCNRHNNIMMFQFLG